MDVIATVLLSLLGLAAGAGVLFASPFLVMATDSAGENADLKPLGKAYFVIVGGVALGVLGAGIGVFRAARHHSTMWIWPAMGIAVIGLCFLLGGWLATKVSRESN